jgi:hypothetical protein
MRTELIIKLKSASNNTVVDSKYTNFRVVFVGCQSLIAGNYTSTVTRVSPAATIVRPVDNVTMTSVNNFETMQSGIWSPGTLAASGEGYDLVDICGEITISEQNLAGIYSNLLRGLVTNNGTDGSVISATQFETTYEIGFTGNTVWREYRSTYTRN